MAHVDIFTANIEIFISRAKIMGIEPENMDAWSATSGHLSGTQQAKNDHQK